MDREKDGSAKGRTEILWRCEVERRNFPDVIEALESGGFDVDEGDILSMTVHVVYLTPPLVGESHRAAALDREEPKPW